MAHKGRGYPYLKRRDLSFTLDYRRKLALRYYTLKDTLVTNFSKTTWPFYFFSDEGEVDADAGTVRYYWPPPTGAAHAPMLEWFYELRFAEVPVRCRVRVGIDGVWGSFRTYNMSPPHLSPIPYFATLPTVSNLGFTLTWDQPLANGMLYSQF